MMLIGTNISIVRRYSYEWAFTDFFKRSEEWLNTSEAPFGGSKDSDGWITALGASPNNVAHAIVAIDLSTHWPAGDYTVAYDGTGTINFASGQGTYTHPTLTITTPGNGGIWLELTATNASPNHLRNIRIYRPGGICSSDPFTHVTGAGSCSGDYVAYSAGTVRYSPEFLASIKNYACIRFMDFQMTNDQLISTWANRPLTTDYTWGVDDGVPVEVIVELCNQLNINPWFCMPHQATDDYVTQFATYVKDNLNSNLSVRVEYSNECWNSIFDQYAYCVTQAGVRGIPGSGDPQKARRFYSVRAVEIFALWYTAWAGATSRVIRVLGVQSDNTAVITDVMGYLNAYLSADEMATAPYLYGAGADLNALFADMNSEMTGTTFPAVEYDKSQADVYSVDLVCYEGGQHLTGASSVFDQAQKDSRMGTLYDGYLAGLQSRGVSLFCHFNNCDFPYGANGRWGAQEWLGDVGQRPKYDSLQNFIEAQSGGAIALDSGGKRGARMIGLVPQGYR
jgi:hypothetical protein